MINGCSRGIGRAILDRLILSGDYRVYAVSKNTEELISIDSKNLTVYKCDLSVTSNAINVVKEVQEVSGGIDILINNAGVGIFRRVEELNLDDWNNVLTLNLTIPFIMVKNILPSMKLKNFGRIVNISSDADYICFSEGSAYCASKFGLRGFSDSVRDELKGFNIYITTISPGRVDTFFNEKKPGDRPNSLSADDVARQIMHVLEQRERCGIERIYLRSTLE